MDVRADYETAVRALRTKADLMRREGKPIEKIARVMHAERRQLAAFFKERTPEPMRQQIYQRTFTTYGDWLGPTIETLRARGKTWEEITESATRTGETSLDGECLVFWRSQ